MEKTTLILSVCILLLLSSSGLAYYFISREEEKSKVFSPIETSEAVELTESPQITSIPIEAVELTESPQITSIPIEAVELTESPQITSIPITSISRIPTTIPTTEITSEITSTTPVSDVNWAGRKFTKDGRCGPQFENKACTGKACCSIFGWCGGSTGQDDDWCGKFKAFNGEYNGEKPV
jgi:hypothetical protein